MRFVILLFLFLLSARAFSQKSNDTLNLKWEAIKSLNMEDDVSLINLIANPGKYNGKKIRVIGYLHLEMEGNAVYLHKEDADVQITKNGFWVDFSSKLTKLKNPFNYNDRYVTLIGVFDANKKGHMDFFSGTLKDIVWLDKYPSWEKPEPASTSDQH